MFQCGSCHFTSEAKEKPLRVVSETRERIYEHRDPITGVPIGSSKGSEIVSEINLCPRCAKVGSATIQ